MKNLFAFLLSLVIVPFVFVKLIHMRLCFMAWYRWGFYSLVYPFLLLEISRRYNTKTPTERLRDWSNYEISEHWSKKYWFGKAISRYILKKYVKA